MKSRFYSLLKVTLVAILGLGATSASAQYCTTGLYSIACTSDDYISSVITTGGSTNISNITACNNPGPNYTYFSAMTHTGIQGTNVNFTVGVGPFGQGIKIWVDWNNNGLYTDIGDLVYNPATTVPGNGTQSGSFVIPFTATPGVKRMRVRAVYASTTFTDCNATTFGEVEEYNLQVVAAIPCSSVSAGTASGPTSPVCLPTTLSLNGFTSASGITIQWQSSPNGANNWTDIPGATGSSYNLTTQTATMYDYRAVVTCANGPLTANSNTVTVTVNSFLACYCFTSTATSTVDDDIGQVVVGNFANPVAAPTVLTNNPAAANLYTDFTALGPIQLFMNYNTPINLTQINSGSYYTCYAKAWIDYNHNGSFTDAGEEVFSQAGLGTPASPSFTGTFLVPPTAQTGTTRMRVSLQEFGSAGSVTPCNTYTWGETEDYFVFIKYAPPPPTASANTPICSGGTLTLTASTNTPNTTIIWNAPNGSFIGTGSPIVINNVQANQSGTYIARVVQGPDTSGPTNVVVVVNQTPNAPAAPATNIVYCLNDSASALLAYGINLKWYSTPVGGTASTTTPIPNTTQFGTITYYVSQTSVAGCESQRTAITVTVVAKPPAPTVKTPIYYCQTDAAVPLTAGGQNLKWYLVDSGGLGSGIAPTPQTGFQDTLTYYVSQTVAGCEGPRSRIDVIITYRPNALILASRPFVCQYDTLTFNYFGSGLSTAAYNWGFPLGSTIISGQNGQGPLVVRFDSAGKQRVTLTVSNGSCMSPVANYIVDVLPAPTALITTPPNACQNEPLLVALDFYSPGVDSFQYQLDGGTVAYGSTDQGPFAVEWATPGVKTIRLRVVDGICGSKEITHTLTVRPTPDARISLGNSGDICASDSIKLMPLVIDAGSQYTWSPERFFDEYAGIPVTYARIDFESYVRLDVTSEFGCTSADSILVSPKPCCNVTFPTAFTPNSDGKNDKFRPISNGNLRIKSLRVFNRWGQVMFETANQDVPWDGSYNGEPQDMGTYYYFIKFDCNNGVTSEQKGEVILIR